MATRLTPASIWGQLGNFCFLCSGLWTDTLVIRFWLTFAYIFLLILYATGIPAWPDVIREGYISVDGIVWSCINLYAHTSSLIRLIGDEMPVTLGEDEEALWRMFYRHSGVSKLQFKQYVSKYFTLVELDKGTKMNTEGYFFIILDGVVQCDWFARDKKVPLTLYSGAMFDIQHLHHFPKSSVFADSTLSATTVTESRIFQCSIEDLTTISKSPLVKDAWQALLISALSLIAERPWKEQEPDEEKQVPKSERNHMFLPLEEYEEPCPYSAGSGSATRFLCNHFLTTLKTKFLLPWPLMPWVAATRHFGSLPAPPHEMPLDEKSP